MKLHPGAVVSESQNFPEGVNSNDGDANLLFGKFFQKTA